MKKAKSVKIAIVASLIIIEALVWTITSPISAWSSSYNGGIDGPSSSGNSGQAITEVDEIQKPSLEDERVAEEAEEAEESEVVKAAEANGLLILVNKQHSLDSSYKPDDLEAIKYYAPDRAAVSRYMRAEAAVAFHNLVESAALEEVEILMTTAYRAYDFQKILYENYVAAQGQEAADKFSAKPGQSEHQTGLSVDVSSASVDYELTSLFGDTVEGRWLAEHSHEYGFIIRFPKGKEEITGYMYEPWHIRYVGKQVAKEIYEQGLTLEEYLSDDYQP